MTRWHRTSTYITIHPDNLPTNGTPAMKMGTLLRLQYDGCSGAFYPRSPGDDAVTRNPRT
jgi:hypothetical protein